MKRGDKSSAHYIALDFHKQYAVAAAVDWKGGVLRKSREVTNTQLPDWAKGHLYAVRLSLGNVISILERR